MAFNRATALHVLRSENFLELGMSANQMRCKLHLEDVVTYEVCGRATSWQEAVEEAAHHRSGSITLANLRDIESIGLNSLEPTLRAQREQSPAISFHHLPLSRLHDIARSGGDLAGTLRRLQGSGLRSVIASFSPATPGELPESQLLVLLQMLYASDISVSASITIGKGESLDERIALLASVHDLQQETKALQSVLVRVHHAASPEERREEEATAVDYLRTLAATRLFLDNVNHVQTDWSVMGPKVLELALRFGADDAGSVPWSQVGNPEPSHHGGEAELRRIIRDAGFRPVERDALFRQSLLH